MRNVCVDLVRFRAELPSRRLRKQNDVGVSQLFRVPFEISEGSELKPQSYQKKQTESLSLIRGLFSQENKEWIFSSVQWMPTANFGAQLAAEGGQTND